MQPAWVDHGHSCADTLQRLQHRRQRRAAQTESHRGGQHTFVMTGLTIAYRVIDGMFIRTDDFGNVLVLELPTFANPRFHAEVRVIGFVPTDFAVDTTQDLIVFLTLEPESWVKSFAFPRSLQLTFVDQTHRSGNSSSVPATMFPDNYGYPP